MLFSCKISHSILTYLDRQGADLGVLFEACEYPSEFLRNPSHWLEAEKMEELLGFFLRDYNRFARETDLITESGHACKDLRSWGVLDSVLRMMQAPKDIYAQPDRFISYFVSPAPPVANVLREPNAVFFELPISATQYPLVTRYLRSAFEALPTYLGKAMATVAWDEIRVAIDWSENQESLFGTESQAAAHLSPDFVRSVLANLESTTKQLEETKAQLAHHERELQAYKSGAIRPTPVRADSVRLSESLNVEIEIPAQEALKNVYRLNDYLARANQLITLLVAQGRQTPQVQEAMRRVDWSFVQSESPDAVKLAAQNIRKIQELIQSHSLPPEEGTSKAAANLSLQKRFELKES